MSYEIDITARLSCPEISVPQLKRSVYLALGAEGVAGAVLSVTLTDNPTIQQLNQRHLHHDHPTDVISFPLDWRHPSRNRPDTGPAERSRDANIEGEIIASVEYARSVADRFGWTVQSELTLYVIHGMLHICGYDDLLPAERSTMRGRETAILTQLGMTPTECCNSAGSAAGDSRESEQGGGALPSASADPSGDATIGPRLPSTRGSQEDPG